MMSGNKISQHREMTTTDRLSLENFACAPLRCRVPPTRRKCELVFVDFPPLDFFNAKSQRRKGAKLYYFSLRLCAFASLRLISHLNMIGQTEHLEKFDCFVVDIRKNDVCISV